MTLLKDPRAKEGDVICKKGHLKFNQKSIMQSAKGFSFSNPISLINDSIVGIGIGQVPTVLAAAIFLHRIRPFDGVLRRPATQKERVPLGFADFKRTAIDKRSRRVLLVAYNHGWDV